MLILCLMAKTIDITIKESEQQLNYLLRKQDKLLQQGRVKALLLIKQGKVKYTYQIADKLKRGRRTIYNWLNMYREKGIEQYLTVSPRGKTNDKLLPEEKAILAAKLQDSTTEITSYVDLLHWVNNRFQKDIAYHVIYKYCRSHLNSRLKIARKSHYKKDQQAVEAFKKTTPVDKGV